MLSIWYMLVTVLSKRAYSISIFVTYSQDQREYKDKQYHFKYMVILFVMTHRTIAHVVI